MKRLIGALAVLAAPLFVLGAAAPAEAGHCKCDKPGHHAKAYVKKHKAKPHARKPHHAKGHHAKGHHASGVHHGGMNTYGWQRHHGHAAPGYGTSHGPGYGYVGEANREGGYARSYSSYDVKTYEYDSGWVQGGPVPAPYGAGAGGHVRHHDSGWVRPGAGPCPHPGAVMCLPAGHPPVGHHAPMSYGYGGHDVKVQPELFYGGQSGGVAGPESYGGYPTGGGTVVFGSTTGGSVYSSARAEAYAAASAHSRAKAYGGRRGYKKRH